MIRVRNPSVTVIFTSFYRFILIMFGGIIIIGSSFLLPHLFTQDQLFTRPLVANSTPNFNTSFNYLSPPIHNNAISTSINSTENSANNYLLILRQNQTNQRSVFLTEHNLPNTDLYQEVYF